MINKLNKLILAVTLLAQFMGSAGYAQQQTGQVAPSTNNPQGSRVELFNNQQASQTTNPQQLPSNNIVIEIPKGKPSAAPQKTNNSYSTIMIILAIVCLIIAVYITVRVLLHSSQIDEHGWSEFAVLPPSDNVQKSNSSNTKSLTTPKKRYQKKKKRKKRR